MIKVSFVIPTLNTQNVLDKCLKSIKIQKFNRKEYEIIIADGGSTDNTLKIAKKYHCLIINNPLKTAEAGKAIGLKQAQGKYIALIDSDNILPNPNWLNQSIYPLELNPKIVGSEPLFFTYRSKSGIFERYSALIGANDPYAFITGVYDRQNYINYKWTNLKIETKEFSKYLLLTLNHNQNIPTIGANGTIFRSSFLKTNFRSDYLFDIDVISEIIKKTKKPVYFAKTKIGIIHTFCESSLNKFIKKQKRRLIDYYNFQSQRHYSWNQNQQFNQIKFILYSILIIPALFDSIRGFIHKQDWVWFIHPFMCLITLHIYLCITIKFKFGLLKPLNRSQWSQ